MSFLNQSTEDKFDDEKQQFKKIRSYFIYAFLIAVIVISKPSEESHRGALLLAINNSITKTSQRDPTFNEECEDSKSRILINLVGKALFSGQKYLNLGVASISYSSRIISLSAVGHIFVLKPKNSQIIKESEALTYLNIYAFNKMYQGKDDSKSTINCYKIKDQSPETVAMTKKSAEHGDKLSQWSYAQALYDGEGIEKNRKEAFKWYKKSAVQGFAMSQLQMSRMLITGDGIEENKKEAMIWLEKATNNGVPEAKTLLGNLYIHSDLESNKKKGFILLKEHTKSKGDSDPEALFNMALCYYHGFGTEVDHELAFEWFLKSAKKEHPKAQLAVAKMYGLGQGIEQNKERFTHWIKKSATNGNEQAKSFVK